MLMSNKNDALTQELEALRKTAKHLSQLRKRDKSACNASNKAAAEWKDNYYVTLKERDELLEDVDDYKNRIEGLTETCASLEVELSDIKTFWGAIKNLLNVSFCGGSRE